MSNTNYFIGVKIAVFTSEYNDSTLCLHWLLNIFSFAITEQSKRAWRMLLLDEYESHLSMSVVNYAQKKKILLICLLSHTTHLLQPLNVGLFDSLQHYYVLKMNRLAQLSISHVSKPQFLEILTSAQLKAYITKNVAFTWKKTGIELYNPVLILDCIFDAQSSTSSFTALSSDISWTSQTVVQMNEVLNHLLRKKWSSTMLCEVKMLAKSVKRFFTEIKLQAACEKDLLKVNAHWKMRKIKLTTKTNMFLTSETANELCRKWNQRDTMKVRKIRLHQTQEKRLTVLQKKEVLSERKRCLKRCLIILFDVFLDMREELNTTCFSEAFTDLEEAWLEVIDV